MRVASARPKRRYTCGLGRVCVHKGRIHAPRKTPAVSAQISARNGPRLLSFELDAKHPLFIIIISIIISIIIIIIITSILPVEVRCYMFV